MQLIVLNDHMLLSHMDRSLSQDPDLNRSTLYCADFVISACIVSIDIIRYRDETCDLHPSSFIFHYAILFTYYDK